MRPIYLITAAVVLMAALSWMLWSLQRRSNEGMKRLKHAAEKLQALNDLRAAGNVGVDEEKQAALRAAIDEMLRATVDADRKGRQPAIYAALTLLVLVPLAATAMYQRGSPHREELGAHGLAGSGTAPPIDHGVDMQTAIAKLADKLRQHPDDAQGWALLGRTYKAMRQYAQARDAFGHAMAAAPGDADLAQEYATAETPNPEPPATSGTMPQACAVAGWECSSAGADEAQAATRINARTTHDLKFRDQVALKGP
jgi:cytochrome c-type biogenesis protein CcmH